jgi:signal transduction histidine kinase
MHLEQMGERRRTAMNYPTASTPLAERFELGSETDTRLHGYWLVLVRLVCLTLSVLTVGLFVADIPSYLAKLHQLCTGAAELACQGGGQFTPGDVGRLHELGLSLDFYATYTIVITSIFALGYWLVAAFLFWRKSDDRVALLAAVSLALFPMVFNTPLINALPSPWLFLVQCIRFLGTQSLGLFIYLFPNGHFVPRWMRWVFVATLIYWVFNAFFPFASFNPFSVFTVLGELILLGPIGTIVVVQIFRYRRVSSPTQRQQTKWVVYGISMGWGGYLVIFTLSIVFPSLFQIGTLGGLIEGPVVYGFMLLVPLSIGLAIVRSRLWEIDILINRTLVYGILSVCVVGVYVLVVGALGALIGTSGNLLISLVATGLVAVLFQPLRAWVQRGVNRLLYGQRDEPYSVITRLSQRLEGTLAPDAVLSTIVETVAQALKLPYVAILLKQEDTFRLSASAGALVGEPLILPLVYQAETIGHMRLAPRTPGEPFTPADRRLLEELVRQAGLAAHAVLLTADLQRSYEQLEQRVQERTRELSSLLEISHTVASTLQLKPLLGLILEQLKLVIDSTGSSILTLEGEDLVILDYRDPISHEHLVPLRFPVKHLGLLWEALRARESIIVPDLREETPLAQAVRVAMGELRDTTLQDVHTWMAVPLILKDHVIGMLVLTSSQAQAFTERHATLALAIANQAAIAIENARLYAQAQALAALEERQKLARELHDSVSQALYGIALGAHTARTLLDRDPDLVAEPLEYVLSLAKAGLAEMRALIFELRPESLETEGLVSALSKQAAALQARYDVPVETDLCDEPSLSLTVKQELYRVAQEALHNTVKHAGASQVNVRLGQTAEAIILEIRDNGRGFDSASSFPGHLGLLSMQERVKNLAGVLSIESTPGQGTTIRARVPAREVIQT